MCAASEIPSLLAGSVFRPHWLPVLAALAAGRIRRAEVEREWEAQIARATDAGLTVTHLDSHQNLHLHPQLFPVAVTLARRFRVPFVRAPRADDPPNRPDAPPTARFRAGLLARLGGRGRRLLEKAGLPEPPRVLGLAEAGHMTAASFARAVADLPEGDYEVALHSGEEDDVTRARYHHGDTRGATSLRPWNPARSRRLSPPAASRRSASGSSPEGCAAQAAAVARFRRSFSGSAS